VAYEDATAYAVWAGQDLPSEAEWERAARAGVDGATYCWGDELHPRGRVMANTWPGWFPWEYLAAGGWGTRPVKKYPPNGFGLFEMTGNVWEWTSDFFTPQHGEGSPDYCLRYRPAARQGHAVETSSHHIGFRCAVRSPEGAPRSSGSPGGGPRP
jgi:formylglycine-generating enzyme